MEFPRPSFFDSQYREWDLNPHSHHWPKDFHTFAVDRSAMLGLCLNRILSNVGCGYIVSTHLGHLAVST